MSDAVLAAVCGPEQPFELDSHIDLHPTYEGPFWDRLMRDAPSVARWVTPQAPLEGLSGRGEMKTERWVDFLVHFPWSNVPAVMEVDGSGHARQPGVDRDRDAAIEASHCHVECIDGSEVEASESALFVRLASSAPDWLGVIDADLLRRLHGPAALHRLAYAIAEACERGFLPVDDPWVIDLRDPPELVEETAGVALDLVSAIAEAWDLHIVPGTIFVGGTGWRRDEDGRYRAGTAQPSREAGVAIAPLVPCRVAIDVAQRPAVEYTGDPTFRLSGVSGTLSIAWDQPDGWRRRNSPVCGQSPLVSSSALRRSAGQRS